MTISEMQLYIEEAETDGELFSEKNFVERAEVIDTLGSFVIGQLGEHEQKNKELNTIRLLKQRAEAILANLCAVDITLFKRLRVKIQAGGFGRNRFRLFVNEYVNTASSFSASHEEKGYSYLDIFVNGLLGPRPMPLQTKVLEPDMVAYQKTPARVIFNLAEQFNFNKKDVFFDIGAGLGQAAILVNLLTGIAARGVEFEPAFCQYANDCAEGLNLNNVTFMNAYAREADYSEGTTFFMFTPFKGKMLMEVLERLRQQSLSRKINIITYGPCTAEVARQSWLGLAKPRCDNNYSLGVFCSTRV